MFKVVSKTLSGDLAASATTTFSYPASTDEDSYSSWGHKAVAIGNVMSSPGDFTLTFGSASVTFTYASGKTTIPAGSVLTLQMNLPGEDRQETPKLTVDHDHVSLMSLLRVDLGSPLTADPNGIYESAAITAAAPITGSLLLDAAALVSGNVGLLGVGAGAAPFGRNIVAAWTTTSVMTVTGTDYLGNTIVESSGSGTTMTGKKAFFTVTKIAVSINVTAATGGTAQVVGLPVFIEGVDEWVTELQDGTTATAGVFVAGISTAATATTGDVRGTYVPNSTLNGALHFVLYMAISDPAYTGLTNYAG